MFGFKRRFPLLLGCFFLWALAACVPQDLVGPPRDPAVDKPTDEEPDDDDPEPPSDPRFSFAISGSATDPYLHYGLPAVGDYDLYLWLMCSNYGLAHLQADFDVVGDALVADHFFSPEDGVVSIVWEEFGQLNLAVNGCPQHEKLLGRLHLTGTGDGVRIGMLRPDSTMGAVGCDDEARSSGFSCVGYASYGSVPPISGSADGCAASPYASSLQFAVSASQTDPNVQSAPSVDGPVLLWLWSLGGAFSAVQGDIHVLDGGAEFDPVFAAVPPFISLNLPDGPDVMLASAGCSSGSKVLGSLLVIDDGTGVWVTMTPGLGGAVVDCDPIDPQGHLYRCRPFSNR